MLSRLFEICIVMAILQCSVGTIHASPVQSSDPEIVQPDTLVEMAEDVQDGHPRLGEVVVKYERPYIPYRIGVKIKIESELIRMPSFFNDLYRPVLRLKTGKVIDFNKDDNPRYAASIRVYLGDQEDNYLAYSYFGTDADVILDVVMIRTLEDPPVLCILYSRHNAIHYREIDLINSTSWEAVFYGIWRASSAPRPLDVALKEAVKVDLVFQEQVPRLAIELEDAGWRTCLRVDRKNRILDPVYVNQKVHEDR